MQTLHRHHHHHHHHEKTRNLTMFTKYYGVQTNENLWNQKTIYQST